MKTSTRPHVNDTFGYHWWIDNDGPAPAFYAYGYGGQYIYVVPSLDLVAVITANWGLPPDRVRDPKVLLHRFVLPAAIPDPELPDTTDLSLPPPAPDLR
jgi:CubicO group peptidase (beta-lactamase class C family)